MVDAAAAEVALQGVHSALGKAVPFQIQILQAGQAVKARQIAIPNARIAQVQLLQRLQIFKCRKAAQTISGQYQLCRLASPPKLSTAAI